MRSLTILFFYFLQCNRGRNVCQPQHIRTWLFQFPSISIPSSASSPPFPCLNKPGVSVILPGSCFFGRFPCLHSPPFDPFSSPLSLSLSLRLRAHWAQWGRSGNPRNVSIITPTKHLIPRLIQCGDWAAMCGIEDNPLCLLSPLHPETGFS